MIQVSGVPRMEGSSLADKPARGARDGGELTFGQYLSQALARVESAQQDAARASEQLASGQAQDLAQVMIASEKATLSLQMALAVRNKVLEAYQEIMRMPL